MDLGMESHDDGCRSDARRGAVQIRRCDVPFISPDNAKGRSIRRSSY